MIRAPSGVTRYALFGSLEQAHAELVLELFHRDAQGRLTDVATLGRTAKVLLLAQGDDVAEFGERHESCGLNISQLIAKGDNNSARY